MDYRTTDYPNHSPAVLLSLLERSNDIVTLQGRETHETRNSTNPRANDFESSSFEYRVPKTEDELVDNRVDYEGDESHSRNKKRRTSHEHPGGIDDVEPTTKRGLPPTTSRANSWFYITKSHQFNGEVSGTESAERVTGNPMIKLSVDGIDSESTTTDSSGENSTESAITVSTANTLDQVIGSHTRFSPGVIPTVTPSFESTGRSEHTLPAGVGADSQSDFGIERVGERISDTTEMPSLIEDFGTTPISMEDVPVTFTTFAETTIAESTSNTVETTNSKQSSGTSEKSAITSTEPGVTDRRKVERSRERVASGRENQFGRKVSRRPVNRNYFTELRESSERRVAEEGRRRSQHLRGRIPASRGRHRYRSSTSSSTILTTTHRLEEHTKLPAESIDSATSPLETVSSATTGVPLKSSPKSSDRMGEEETSNSKDKSLGVSDHRNEEVALEEHYDKSETITIADHTEKAVDVTEAEAEGRPLAVETTGKPEVTTLKSTRITSRTSAALSTRLRKVSTTAAPVREASLANPRRTALSESKIPTKDVIIVTEAPKSRVDEKAGLSDQSIRAQELAVTVTEPPASQAPSTGRLPTRETLRRKISTTVAPRADTTTTTTTTAATRSTVRFRGRLKNTREKPLQNVTTRPRRPAVVDYDYYEDELEPVVAKSTLNGKLFLTSRGTIRCLDQGNFPHPYSCKKFITCARMVNGQVIGAEYTCPHKLSFDPIGGICNWSAGLGCKE